MNLPRVLIVSLLYIIINDREGKNGKKYKPDENNYKIKRSDKGITDIVKYICM